MSDKKSAVIDLASLDTAALCDQGAELELNNPATGEPLGVYLTLAGVDSKTFRNALGAVAGKRAKRRGSPTIEEIRAEDVELAARCTLAWRNVVVDGQELPCTLDNARQVYRRFPWMREQASNFAGDRGSYLGE
ncbi:hypothetical protein [Desulfovibrio porci]|uniref:hypothetical protein n=1 Tax=Desulfovibrio porci TaxID=2605782 RepID=UPI003A93EAB2